MTASNVTVDFDPAEVKARISPRIKRAQKALDVQVLKDSNYYIPEDTGTLKASGVVASGGGEIKWDTPYARRQYHELPNKSKDRNPNASTKWFERAKSVMLNTWQEIVNREYNS